MKTRGRLRAARRSTLAVVAVSVLLLTTGAGPAAADTSTDLQYSTDGGTTWSTSATVAPGATVLVRQWFDNDGTADETDASLTTEIPAGFSLNGGSTQVCLNPSTTNPSSPDASELKCEAANEGSVWTGPNLQVSPSAGHYGESNGSTSGDLVTGKVRYVNLHQCHYRGGSPGEYFYYSTVGSTTNPIYSAGTNASNTPDASPSCGDGNATWWWPYPGGNGVSTLDLLGNRYLNIQKCTYTRDAGVATYYSAVAQPQANPNFAPGTNASNTPDASPSCAPGNAEWSPYAAGTATQAVDLRGNRYLNLHQCMYANSDVNTAYYLSVGPTANPIHAAGTNASSTPDASPSCGAGSAWWGPYAPGTSVLALDLLDPARGHGYVEYAITAPPMDSACADDAEPLVGDQTATLASAPSGASSSSGTITVEPALLDPDDPECVIPMVDPMAVGIGGGMAAVAAAAYVLHRRRQVTLA